MALKRERSPSANYNLEEGGKCWTTDFLKKSLSQIVKEFGMDMYMLLYLKWITNKDLLYSTGNSAQHSCHCIWQPGWKRCLGENGYMYGWVPELFTLYYHHTFCYLAILQYKIKIKKRKIPLPAPVCTISLGGIYMTHWDDWWINF